MATGHSKHWSSVVTNEQGGQSHRSNIDWWGFGGRGGLANVEAPHEKKKGGGRRVNIISRSLVFV